MLQFKSTLNHQGFAEPLTAKFQYRQGWSDRVISHKQTIQVCNELKRLNVKYDDDYNSVCVDFQ